MKIQRINNEYSDLVADRERYMSSMLQAFASTSLRLRLFIVWNSLASNPVERSAKNRIS